MSLEGCELGASSSEPRTLVTGGTVFLGAELRRADLEIRDGRIAAILEPGSPAAGAGARDTVWDVSGKLVFPGLTNAHFHSHDALARGLLEDEYLESWILRVLPPAFPPRSTEEVEVRTLLGALDNLKNGVTAVQDMVTFSSFSPELLNTVAWAYRKVGIRAAVGVQYGDVPGSQTRPLQTRYLPPELRSHVVSPAEPSDDDALDAIVSACFSGGQLAGDLVEWVLAPTAPESLSDGLLERTAAASRDLRTPVFTHLNESRTRAVESRLLYPADGGSALARMHRLGLGGPRVNVAHGVWFTDAEIDMLAEAGTGVVLNVLSNLKLKSGVPPVSAYRAAGVRVALGTDNLSCSDAANMFQAMKLTALLESARTHEPVPAPAQFVFRAATVGGAAALGHSGERGLLTPGMAADLFTVDASDPAWLPLNHPVRQLVYSESGRAVRDVMVAGRWTIRGGHSTLINERELAERAAAVARGYRRDFEEVSARTEVLRLGLDQAHSTAANWPLGFDRMV